MFREFHTLFRGLDLQVQLKMLTNVPFVIGLICWIIIHLILLPYETYWCYKFWQQRKELIITKREPILVIVLCYAFAIYICVVMTATVIQDQFTDYTEDNSNLFRTGGLINDCFLVPLLWIASLAAISRYWILFYRIVHNVAVLNNKWQSVLDPNIIHFGNHVKSMRLKSFGESDL